MATDTNQPAVGELTHLYATPGVYSVVIADENNAARSKSFVIVVPFGPVMTVVEDATDATRRSVTVTVNNYGEGNVTVDWGDNTPRSSNSGNNVETSRHRYANAGVYTINVVDADDATRFTSAQVTVPFSTVDPVVTTAPATSDTTGMTVSLLVDNHGAGAVDVNWGDSTTAGTNPGDGTTPTTHAYVAANTYTITATDQDNPQLQGDGTFVAPTTPAPTLTPSEDAGDVTGMTVSLLVQNNGNGTVTVDWGDSTADGTNAGDNTTPTTHQYATAGSYTITATDQGGGGAPGTAQVTLPFDPAPVLLASVDPADASRMTVDLLVDNHGDGDVTVDWGDGSPTETNPGDNTTPSTHTYAAAEAVVITAAPEGAPGEPAGTQDLTLPVPPSPTPTAAPLPGDGSGLGVSVLVDNGTNGEVTINWGDETPTETNPGDGTTPSTHTYAEGGSYAIAADANDGSLPAVAQVTLPWPAPTPTVTEDDTDTTGMTVSVLVDNHSHGAVDIAWGDGTPSGTNPGDNTTPTTHQFAAAGTYTIAVTDTEGGPAGTVDVTVPMEIAPEPYPRQDLTDGTGMTVYVMVDNHGDGAVTLDWGDGTPTGTNPGNGTTATWHQYATAGTYTITAIPTQGPQGTTQVSVPMVLAPVVTATQDDTDGTGMSVSVLVDNHGHGTAVVTWGEGAPATDNPGDNTTPSTHQYANPGTYTISATSAAASPTGTAEVTVPMTVAPEVMPAEDTSDVTGMTVSVTVDNHSAGSVTVDWGDSTATATNPGDNATPTTHQYATGGTYTITATPTAGGPTGTAMLTVPFTTLPKPTLNVNGADLGIDIQILDPQAGHDYEIQWEDAGTWEAMTGTPPEAHHTYPAAGTYTIKARYQDTPSVISDPYPVDVPWAGLLAAFAAEPPAKKRRSRSSKPRKEPT